MHNIIIPTFNRSAKLNRTLKCYADFSWKSDYIIYVLDGSSADHCELNKAICSTYKNVEYKYRPDLNFIERIKSFLETLRSEQLVCLATDEDVFIPTFLDFSADYLTENKDYSMVVGRYITFEKPLISFYRISQHRSVAIDFDILSEDVDRRLIALSHAITVGCSPVFWGVRRVADFLESIIFQEKFFYQTTQEMADQILLALQGKIKFLNMPMLLRDETNLNYVSTPDRQDNFNYFPVEEANLLYNLVCQKLKVNSMPTLYSFIDKFSIAYVPSGQPSIAVQAHHKSYTKFTTIGESKYVDRFVYFVSKSFMILIEIVTALHEVSVLRRYYGRRPINTFLRRIVSNERALDV